MQRSRLFLSSHFLRTKTKTQIRKDIHVFENPVNNTIVSANNRQIKKNKKPKTVLGSTVSEIKQKADSCNLRDYVCGTG